MSKLAILDRGNPILETPSKALSVADIVSPKIQKLITSMQETLHAIPDGVGLAAPQVGQSLQIFIVSRRIMARKKDGKEMNLDGLKDIKDLVCINPKIIKASKTKKWMDGEGCLSVRWYYGKVFRSINVTLEYFDENGKKTTRGAGGLLAHIFQHEMDHLKGELFIDKAKDVAWFDPVDVPDDLKSDLKKDK